MKKNIIIFGSGEIGKRALKFIGKEFVKCFADNNKERCQYNIDGIEIVDFQYFKKIYKDYNILICANNENSIQIINQFYLEGVAKYWVFDGFDDGKSEIVYDIINSSESEQERVNTIINCFNKKLNYLETQIKYLNESNRDTELEINKENWRREHKIEENEKVTTVEFYLIDAFEIYHFLPLYYTFEKAGIYSTFIAEPNVYNTSGKWFDYKTAIQVLESFNVRYSSRCNPDCDYAVTTQHSEILKKYNGKKIHMCYGFGLKKHYFCDNDSAINGFDIKLVHGEYQMKLLSDKHINLFKVGYLKHIDFLKKGVNVDEIKRALCINTDKKIIVYFPTWNDYSTILDYANSINELRKEYFVISKPHHCTSRLKSEEERLNRLKMISDIVLDGNFDFGKAAILGDIVICDAISGASTEVPYLNRKCKVILIKSPVEAENCFKEDVINDYSYLVSKPSELREILENETDIYCESREKKIKLLYETAYEKEISRLIEFMKKSE